MSLDLHNYNFYLTDNKVTAYYQDKVFNVDYLVEIDSIKTQLEALAGETFDSVTIQLVSGINNPRLLLIENDVIVYSIDLSDLSTNNPTLSQDLDDVRALIEADITSQIAE